jgi:hypothetical protein
MCRNLGGMVGGIVMAAILTSASLGAGIPTEQGVTRVFALAGALSLVTAVLVWRIPDVRSAERHPGIEPVPAVEAA